MRDHGSAEQVRLVAQTMGWSLGRAEAFLDDLESSSHAIIEPSSGPPRRIGAEEAYGRLLSEEERHTNRERVSLNLDALEPQAAKRRDERRQTLSGTYAIRVSSDEGCFVRLVGMILVLDLADRLLPLNHAASRTLDAWLIPAVAFVVIAYVYRLLRDFWLERKRREQD